jgi:hypothetical protein
MYGCGKTNTSITCEMNNSVYYYRNNYFTINPDIDSFSITQPIEIKLTLPRKFYEEEYNRPVEFHKNEVFSAMNIIVLDSVGTGAVNLFDFNATIGKLYRDTVSYDTEYIRNRNLTASAVGQAGDSLLKAHYILKPKQRGNYLIAFTSFGTKDTDCSLFRYYVKPQVMNQHLNLLAAVSNGYISDYERTYAYCFKVY